MDWLNYHHLLYFWTVVREGGISKATAAYESVHSIESVKVPRWPYDRRLPQLRRRPQAGEYYLSSS